MVKLYGRVINHKSLALAGVTGLQTKRLPVQFPVRAMPGLQARSQLRMSKRQLINVPLTHQCFSACLFPSFLFSKNIFLKALSKIILYYRGKHILIYLIIIYYSLI